MFRGKKYQDSAKKIDKNAQYDANEAMGLNILFNLLPLVP